MSFQEREKEDRKVAKEDKERKVQEATSKARNLMANFFGKPKPAAAASSSTSIKAPAGLQRQASTESGIASSSQSDYARTFRTFTVKKDVELAPINHFSAAARRGHLTFDKGKGREIILIDEEEKLDDTRKSATSDVSTNGDVRMADTAADLTGASTSG
jgi:chromatin assembly factor 1 subunit A